MIFNTQLITCLAACLAALPSATAAPLPRNDSGKRIVLWDWTNTRDAGSYPGLQASAKSIASASKIFAVVNWGTQAPAEIPAGVRFQPMIRSPAELSGNLWQAAVDQATNNKQRIIHYFNEPERAGISVDTAVQFWRSKLLPLRASTGCLLVSPAPASNDQGSAWLADFMSRLSPEEKPNYLGVHFYTNPDTAAEAEVANAKKYLEDRSSTYGLPLVVSEIGSTSRDATSVQTFTQQMAEYMDSSPSVLEYGFFGASRVPADDFVSPAAQLLNSAGDWTTLGSWLLNN
ncbi:glycosyl hydrolase catalytic core-domain-containing protein [Microdochium trichocladiopsis]|uniref:Glycosyl hydrolase catalytic core-domain-containing protein n=1 Tax=Microdochium trichocladiopsis TaxID=1682393 RepID=A0A9P8YJA7_9PEZI|nr:glycosyl hydrolase catalytic core-domain-containing protein [Microdochium trichocladiopsis]KAH7041017.1 glycosyl hydrolase catalytic core-domain-containing protein [Microdochium trichocladiopsis]